MSRYAVPALFPALMAISKAQMLLNITFRYCKLMAHTVRQCCATSHSEMDPIKHIPVSYWYNLYAFQSDTPTATKLAIIFKVRTDFTSITKVLSS